MHATAASQAAFCDPMATADARVFGGSVTGGNALAGRGGVVREPDLSQTHADMPASAKGKAGRNFKATIPVYFHVVTDGAIGAVTDSQIAGQIAVLNNTCAGGEGGAATGFSFKLAGITRTSNPPWFYANPGGADEQKMKTALKQGGDNALNWYSTTAGDYLGWAYLPDITTKPGNTNLDGVVVDWESVPGTSATYAGRYDQGETGSYTEFTAGQVQRMRDAWLLYRAS